MMMQPGADKMHTAFVSPADGVKVTDNSLPVKVSRTGYDIRCDLAGKEDKEGTGHIHILLDKELVNMFCTEDTAVSMQNVKPGKHTLTVIPAQNNHTELEKNGQSITFDYQPTNPLPAITDATISGKAIKILSPKAGDTVKGDFDVTVQVSNFNLNCDLFGKPGVAGYGHWHLNLDADTGPMMGMGTMLRMSCTSVIHATTAGLKAGTTHTLIALLVDNSHAPFHPDINDKVEVKIGS
jgi:hypothetical protein